MSECLQFWLALPLPIGGPFCICTIIAADATPTTAINRATKVGMYFFPIFIIISHSQFVSSGEAGSKCLGNQPSLGHVGKNLTL